MLYFVVLYCINDDLVRKLKFIPLLSTHGISLASVHLDSFSHKVLNLRLVLQKGKRAKGNKEMYIARVKCYNCENKGSYAQNCPEPIKVPSS